MQSLGTLQSLDLYEMKACQTSDSFLALTLIPFRHCLHTFDESNK